MRPQTLSLPCRHSLARGSYLPKTDYTCHSGHFQIGLFLVPSPTWQDLAGIVRLVVVRKVQQQGISLACSSRVLLVRQERIGHERRKRRQVLEQQVVDVAGKSKPVLISGQVDLQREGEQDSRSSDEGDADGEDHGSDVEEGVPFLHFLIATA